MPIDFLPYMFRSFQTPWRSATSCPGSASRVNGSEYFSLNLTCEASLSGLSLILQIVFFLAIAIVLYMFWRDRMRHEIETWSERSNRVFYGSGLLIIVDFAAYFWPGRKTVGLDAFAFIVVLILAAYAMYRVWRAERTYGY